MTILRSRVVGWLNLQLIINEVTSYVLTILLINDLFSPLSYEQTLSML